MVRIRPLSNVGKLLFVASLVSVCAMPCARASLADARAAVAEAEAAAEELAGLVEAGISSKEQGDKANKLQGEAQTALHRAATLYRRAGAARSEEVAVVDEFATVLERTGDYDLAAEALARAVILSPEDAHLRVRRGVNLSRVGGAARKEATQVLLAALNMAPTPEDTAKAQYALGSIYFREGLYPLAREAFTAALAAQPDHVLAAIDLSALDVRDGDIVAASKRLEAISRAAQSHDAHRRVVLRDALIDYAKRHFVLRDTPDMHRAYAIILYRAGRIPEAVAAASRAVTLAPEGFETLNLLAALYLEMGNLNEAAGAFRKSLDANPAQPETRKTLDDLQAYLKQQG